MLEFDKSAALQPSDAEFFASLSCKQLRDSERHVGDWLHSILCLKKNVPPLTCYNLYIHGSLATIFGKNVAD